MDLRKILQNIPIEIENQIQGLEDVCFDSESESGLSDTTEY